MSKRVNERGISEREMRAASETGPLGCVHAWCRWVTSPFRSQTGTRSNERNIRLFLPIFGEENSGLGLVLCFMKVDAGARGLGVFYRGGIGNRSMMMRGEGDFGAKAPTFTAHPAASSAMPREYLRCCNRTAGK